MGICTPVDPLTHVGRLIVLPSVTIRMVTNFGNICTAKRRDIVPKRLANFGKFLEEHSSSHLCVNIQIFDSEGRPEAILDE